MADVKGNIAVAEKEAKDRADAKKAQLERASKVISRALQAVSRIGSLKGLETAHISKAESAVSEQTSKAFNRLRNPKTPVAPEFDLTK